ncbi:MAG: hypothetical protein HY042_13425 [Spirochaetia bacterium]|nr:hypothetical protein [Spirochaetia bacterium]
MRIFFSSLILLSAVLAACQSDPVVSRGEETVVFRDPDGRFEFSVLRALTQQKVDVPGGRTYEFLEKNDQNDIIAVVRVTVSKQDDKKKKVGIFDQAYEDKFRDGCRCSVLKMGIVLFQENQAREFQFSFTANGEWNGFQRHVERGGRIYVLEASGPAARLPRIKALYDSTLASFRFLPRADEST